jgi:YidC/Oxa1 family membrane protein insertase
MVLQMPIFWAFYIYLTISLDVRHEPWVLWIKDLSTADPYKILPIVMCVSMIGSSMLQPQPATADPSQRTQRIMMTWLMPIVLTWLFFFSAPSGLVLYWMVSNLVGVAIQFAINRRTAEPAVAVEKPKDRESTKPTSSGSQSKEPDQTKSAKKRDKAEAARKRKMAEKEIVGGVR